MTISSEPLSCRSDFGNVRLNYSFKLAERLDLHCPHQKLEGLKSIKISSDAQAKSRLYQLMGSRASIPITSDAGY
ncbi:hypothetical protein J5288_23830 [Agrobacterium sp. S2/73]|uniref:hypothetical protein n=1 Tax=Agrobacterium sp. S7/73 TaxID=2820002 RepID=UPI001B2AC03F|nr:hypothetical protein [Agrobacterium sp. S7/73]MBO9111759.1 hypothetical protein [Agrobacterium sp. S2/73]